MLPPTPYYLIDERKLRRNLVRIERVRRQCGAKSVLALKCFSTWAVFPLMRRYMDGTTSSSLYEARLGYEKFGGETHAYCVGWSAGDVRAVRRYADKVIFNSAGQLDRHFRAVGGLPLGLRVNPGLSCSHFDLADPARRYSRLGVTSLSELRRCAGRLSGLMFHCNCENDSYAAFARILAHISRRYGALLKRMAWVSLGGGIYFTRDGYPLERFCRALKSFSDTFGVEVYLEPGETAITQSAELVTTVVDIVRNRVPVAIVDASIEAHMLDLLVYRTPAKVRSRGTGRYRYMVAGRSCLAGDIFGTYRFPSKLRVGSTVRFADAAGYTMVKKNWFNGLQMPAIVVRRLDGAVRVVRRFTYRDFVDGLS
jgi:carboxynorspermidine decarboxylase